MKAYHSKKELKDEVLARLAVHRAADEIVQGTYWANGKGCAVGCLTHDPNGGHSQYETRWGIPLQLAYLEDRIFEMLPPESAREWPERFMRAIPVGGDLSLVWPRYAHWLCSERLPRWVPLGKQAEAIAAVAKLYARWLDGELLSVAEWRSARHAAAEAAYDAEAAVYAAYAASAAAEAAAAEAAEAAAYAAVYAAYAASAAASASRAEASLLADKLIEIIEGVPTCREGRE